MTHKVCTEVPRRAISEMVDDADADDAKEMLKEMLKSELTTRNRKIQGKAYKYNAHPTGTVRNYPTSSSSQKRGTTPS